MPSQDLMDAAARALAAPVTARSVAGIVDHTLLKPEATPDQVSALVADARRLDAYAVCLSPSLLPLAEANGIAVAAVCGFPSGAHHAEVKAAEAARCVADGVDEIDMVVNLAFRSEERRVGTECASGSATYQDYRRRSQMQESRAWL